MIDCKLCSDKLGRNEHLTFLAITEMSGNKYVLELEQPDQELADYINEHLIHLNDTQVHYRLHTTMAEKERTK